MESKWHILPNLTVYNKGNILVECLGERELELQIQEDKPIFITTDSKYWIDVTIPTKSMKKPKWLPEFIF